jgi:hypothetical protein
MQIKIRYLGGTSGARKELTNLVRQAGYAIQVDSATGRQAPRKLPPVMTITARPPAGREKRPTSRMRPVNLRALREDAGKTQAEVARRTEMSQPELSRLESRTDHLISTLRKYVRALGGEIEVVASIGGRKVRLRDV